jgi:hypothetical protein
MTELLIIGGCLAFGGLLLWLVVGGAEAKGAAKERHKATTEALDAVKKANETAQDVGALDADTRRKRLLRWSRD